MPQADWNAVVATHHGSFLQTWDWAIFQEQAGHHVRRIRIGHDSNIAAQTNAVVFNLSFGKKALYAPFPLIVSDEPDHVMALVRALQQAGKEENACVVRVDVQSSVLAKALQQAGFTHRRSMQPDTTLIVDLIKTEEQLLAEMHGKTRYNIRVAERHGVTIRKCDAKGAQFSGDIESFLRLLAQTTERDKFSGHDAHYYRTMVSVLSGGTVKASLYLAEREGEVLAGAIMIHHNRRTTYLHGASSNANRQYMAPFLLHWTAMQHAKAAGDVEYDFWGIAPTDDSAHPWAGITRFKKGFGGKIITYAGGWELPMPGLCGTVYRLIMRMRKRTRSSTDRMRASEA